MIALDKFGSWRDAGEPVFTRAQVNGQTMLKIDASSVDRGRWMTGRDLPVVAGKTYQVRAEMLTDYLNEAVYVDEALTAAELVVTLWTADMGYAKTEQVAVRAPDWKTVEMEFEASAAAAFARVEVRAWWVDATVWAYGFEFGQVIDEDAQFLGMGEVWQYPGQIVIQLQDSG